MKYFFLLVLLLFSEISFTQNESEIMNEIEAYQASENEKFGNAETTILQPRDFRNFTKLEFYPIDLAYRVEAKFIRTPNQKPFLMPTTTDRLPEYVKYGEVHFELKGEQLMLNLYQSVEPYEDPEYKEYLFLPFTDLSSGDGSYGGGRFLDAYIPKSDTMILDFNKAYNPYCAYSPQYSCPIPPEENDLSIRIDAGVKEFGAH